MKTILRGMALVFGVLALVALAADLAAYAETGRFTLASTGQRWAELHFSSLQQAQPFVQRYLLPWLWDPVFTETVLLRPAAAVAGVLAFVCHVLGRR